MKTKEIKKFRDSYTKYDKPCVFEGYKLAVLFDEKDDVKKYGGRWDAEGSHWWMPAKKLLEECSPDQSLVRDWLNDNKMTMGPYGKFDEDHADTMNNMVLKRYLLVNDNPSQNPISVHFYEQTDAVSFEGIKRGIQWMTCDEARVIWDELITVGYNRSEDAS